MEGIITAIIKAALAYGPVGIIAAIAIAGWGAAIFLAWRFIKRKDALADEAGNCTKEINNIHDKYSKEIAEINKRYTKTIEDIGNLRVQDFKDITDDYHDLATNTLQALDRVVLQLEVRRASAKGDRNDD